MNERILQLALQAKLIASEYNGFDRTTITPAEQKFAELIIRECAKVADTVEAWDIAPSGVIEKHFGVEE